MGAEGNAWTCGYMPVDVPVDSPVGSIFRHLADERSNAQFHLLECECLGVGQGKDGVWIMPVDAPVDDF
eukprot:295072-Chlamydomonas_euryale.AAC.3